MALAKWQLGLLHTAPAVLRISDEHRRIIQRTHGGHESAKHMDYGGFLRCMAFYESQGYRDPDGGDHHWRMQAGNLDEIGRRPMRAKCVKLACLLWWTADGTKKRGVDFARLDGFVARQTASRPTPRTRLTDCDRGDLALVIEGLKCLCRADPVAREALVEGGEGSR